MITVVSVRGKHPSDMPPNFVYVGRKLGAWAGSPLGNPYRPENFPERGGAIEAFRQWLWMQMKNPESEASKELRHLATIAQSGDLQLGCWCSPQSCHGDVIKAAIEWVIAQEK
jgi:hypothetical protein